MWAVVHGVTAHRGEGEPSHLLPRTSYLVPPTSYLLPPTSCVVHVHHGSPRSHASQEQEREAREKAIAEGHEVPSSPRMHMPYASPTHALRMPGVLACV